MIETLTCLWVLVPPLTAWLCTSRWKTVHVHVNQMRFDKQIKQLVGLSLFMGD